MDIRHDRIKNKLDTSDIEQNWKPKGHILDYPEAFYEWINSINKDFDAMISYSPFEYYVKQALAWQEDDDQYKDYENDYDMLISYVKREVMRCRANSLYYLNKYHFIMEGDVKGGYLKYKAYEAQQVVSYLFDCGYSCMFGKPRQIFFTTTMGGLVLNRTNALPNYKSIYIADQKGKAQKLFVEKIVWPHKKLPTFLRSKVLSARDGVFMFGSRVKDEDAQADTSWIEVLSAKDTAATGFAANFVGLDEIGLTDKLSAIISEIRPALFVYNPETDRLEFRRQLFAWGTGGEISKGGAAMEEEWNAAKKAWKNGRFNHGIIPLFFNVFARKGMTKEKYYEEKKVAYSKSGPERDRTITQFHQHNPITEADMFMRGSKTLVPPDQIQNHLARIYDLQVTSQKGYFEPVTEQHGRITRVKFIPVGDGDYAPVTILKHPVPGWQHRYYKGTDPISSTTGASKMASVVWDSENNEVAAFLNYKEKDFTYIYTQSMLLNIYYGGIKELVETNVGEAYMEFLRNNNWGHLLIGNKALPKHLQTNNQVGIYNTGKPSRFIINELLHCLHAYANNINVEEFWLQMQRFVEKSKANGEVKWEAEDKRYYQDDLIFGTTFAYIAADSFSKYTPTDKNVQEDSRVVQKTYYDENWNLRVGSFSKKSGRFIS